MVIFMATSCDDCKDAFCDAVELADLVIPSIINVLDYNGNPMYYNGYPLQDYNEVYRNRRTGEVFTHLFKPLYGIFPGDVLDIGTRVFNDWIETTCEKGADAPATFTNPSLRYTGQAGTGSVPLGLNFTPPVNFGGQEFTYSTFQLTNPGYYKVDFDANSERLPIEHRVNNNLYSGNNGGSQFGKAIDASFVVTEGESIEPWVCTELPTRVVAECAFYKQFDSGTSEATYLASPLARFMQDPKNLAAFYQFKMENPDKPFILK